MPFDPFQAFLLAGAALAGLSAPDEAAAYAAHRDHVVGVSFDLTVASQDQAARTRATDAALAEIARLDGVLSGWRVDSELAALNDAAHHVASPDLFAVIAFGEAMRARTGGAFSPRLGRAIQAWRDGAEADFSALAQAAEAAPVSLDAQSRTIARPHAVRFDVDGYAKGYVIDRALMAARAASPAAHGFLLNLGGDVGAWGLAPDATAWRVGVSGARHDNASPESIARLSDAAIAVSGGGARDFTRDGKHFAHVVSARTGLAGGANSSVAVVARAAMEGDALATALMAAPAAQGLAWIDATPGAAARIVTHDGGVIESNGWSALATPPAIVSCQAAAATPWPEGFRTEINFEVPRIQAANYERPYVAIWISDQNRRLIKTLLILGDEARWRESNYVFWRRIERLDMAGIQALARTSRAPGRYDVVWDGTDNAGQRVEQGAYTLNIEASREHGAHTFQSVPLALGAAPLEAGAEAQGELGAARVRYGRAR